VFFNGVLVIGVTDGSFGLIDGGLCSSIDI
jgi:hypothetical protein